MELVQQIIAVAAVLGLLALSLWWLRRQGVARFSSGSRRKPARQLQLIERLPLTPHHSLHLVRVADRTILVALSPSGCAVLDAMSGAGVPECGPNKAAEALR